MQDSGSEAHKAREPGVKVLWGKPRCARCWVVPQGKRGNPLAPLSLCSCRCECSLNSAVFKPFVLPPCCKRVELVALLATRVWLGLGFLEVFKGRLPSRTSEHAAGRVAVVGCQRLDSTHTGRSIFLGGGSCCWDSAKPEAGSFSEPGTCTSFPQGWQTR